MRLPKIFCFRLSPELRESLEIKARRLNVRLVDVIRWAIAESVNPKPVRKDDVMKDEKIKV